MPSVRAERARKMLASRASGARPSARVASELDRRSARGELEAFASGRRDNSTLLFGLATLKTWLRTRSAGARAAGCAGLHSAA
jgi:hypothetical protein